MTLIIAAMLLLYFTIGIHDGLVQKFVLFHDDELQAPLSHTEEFKSTKSETPLLLPAVAIIEGYTCCQTLHNMKDVIFRDRMLFEVFSPTFMYTLALDYFFEHIIGWAACKNVCLINKSCLDHVVAIHNNSV